MTRARRHWVTYPFFDAFQLCGDSLTIVHIPNSVYLIAASHEAITGERGLNKVKHSALQSDPIASIGPESTYQITLIAWCLSWTVCCLHLWLSSHNLPRRPVLSLRTQSAIRKWLKSKDCVARTALSAPWASSRCRSEPAARGVWPGRQRRGKGRKEQRHATRPLAPMPLVLWLPYPRSSRTQTPALRARRGGRRTRSRCYTAGAPAPCYTRLTAPPRPRAAYNTHYSTPQGRVAVCCGCRAAAGVEPERQGLRSAGERRPRAQHTPGA